MSLLPGRRIARGALVLPLVWAVNAPFVAACSSSSDENNSGATVGEQKGRAEDKNPGNRCEAKCVQDLFAKRIAALYRPSGEEEAVRKFILDTTEEAKSAWGSEASGIKTELDTAKNLLVRLPATGRYKNKHLRPIAIQSHVDMVLAWKDAAPGQDLKPFFREGVTIVEKDGWFESKDRQSTIGADCAVGTAAQLRYVLDPKIEHPPLELVFTMSEENGLVGASKIELGITAPVLIGTDTSGVDEVTFGSQGTRRFFVEGKLKSGAVAAGQRYLTATVAGTRGGHSGNNIGDGRSNAIKVFADVTTWMRQEAPGTQLVTVTAGDPKGLNKITNSYVAVYSVPADSFDALKGALKAQVLDVLRKDPGEKPDENAALKIEASEASPPAAALLDEATAALVDSIRAAPNGLIVKDESRDASANLIYPMAVRTSSNLGSLSVTFVNDAAKVQIGVMSRGYVNDELDQKAKEIEQVLTAAVTGGELTITPGSSYRPWLLPNDAWLLRVALETPGLYTAKKLMNGGIEPSFLIDKYPGLQVIEVGPNIQEAHTVNERVEVATIGKLVDRLDKLVEAIAAAGEFVGNAQP